ncbi:FxLYD domain-containing protein [bacterium]|nr:FxLYD domain-containing protein [bacterium]
MPKVNEGHQLNLEVIESHSCNLEYGRAICGTVKNNSNYNVGYVHVEINLYDKKGNLIDSTLDNVNNLEGNSTWKFQAPVISDNVTSYKIKNVVGY